MFYNIKTKCVLDYGEMLKEGGFERPENLSDEVIESLGYLNVTYKYDDNPAPHTKWEYGKISLVNSKPVSKFKAIPLTGKELKESKERESHFIKMKKEETDKMIILKKHIEAALISLVVEVNGNIYNADERSIVRMKVAKDSNLGKKEMLWKMKNNNIKLILKADLAIAVDKSIDLFNALFFSSSIEEVNIIVSQNDNWLLEYKSKIKG